MILRARMRVTAAAAGVMVLGQVVPASAAGPLKDITNRYAGSAVAAQYLGSEADYRSVLTREFDSVTDRRSWVPGTFPGEGAAGLFDSNLRPKPAYTRLNP